MSKPLRYKRKGKCVTGKLRYPTEFDAALALGKAQARRKMEGSTKVEQRHYPCSLCGGHHLTSMPRAA